jgi:lipoprotein-anchoring transpeptidase ErfK/SrfK
MMTARQIRWAATAIVAVLGAQAARGADEPAAPKPAIPVAVSATQAEAKRQIVVSLEDRKLALVENGQVVRVYPVAVGKASTPSPTGSFTIARRVANPTYHHDGKTIPPGPRNPVGTRWMGLSDKAHKIHGDYGIHGTNEPRSIGKAASHGCIRMAKADLEDLYPQVQVGDTVELIGHRDEETARLFRDGPSHITTPAPVPHLVLATKAPPSVSAPATPDTNTHTAQSGLEAAAAAVLTGAL